MSSQLPDGFVLDNDLPKGFSLDQPTGVPLSETPIENLQEVARAPELGISQIGDPRAWKAAAAITLMIDDDELSTTLSKIYPGSTVSTGVAGDRRITLPSGEYVVNRPGFSRTDIDQFITRMALFGLTKGRTGFGLKTVGKVAGETAAIEAGAQTAEEILGGDFNLDDVAFSSIGAVMGQGVPVAAKRGFDFVKNRPARKILQESAPTTKTLRKAAGSIYDQADELGVKVKPTAYRNMISQLEERMTREGMRPELTPESARLIEVLKNEPTENLIVSNMETLRKIANGVSNSAEKDTDKFLGSMAVEAIDDFVENIDKNIIAKADLRIDGVPLSRALGEARNMWGRARRSETIQQAIEIASTRRSGVDLGLRNEFANLHRKIIRKTKGFTGFTQQEVDAIKKVAQGGSIQNMAFQLGRLGVPEDQASNALMLTLISSLGGAGGFVAGGLPGGIAGVVGAVGVPTIFRRTASRITQNNAKLADDIIRAADDGPKIIQAYIKNTPKEARNSAEIASLLLSSGAKPKTLKETGNHLIDDAIFGFKNALAAEAQIAEERLKDRPKSTSALPTNF